MNFDGIVTTYSRCALGIDFFISFLYFESNRVRGRIMATKRITDFIEQEEFEEMSLVQAYIPADLRTKVVEQMKLDRKAGFKMTWDKFMEAACLAYLSDRAKGS